MYCDKYVLHCCILFKHFYIYHELLLIIRYLFPSDTFIFILYTAVCLIWVQLCIYNMVHITY